MTCIKRVYGLMRKVELPVMGLILLSVFFLSWTAEADVFYAEGTSPVVGGKKFPAQRLAHTQAFSKAVSMAIDTLFPKGETNGNYDKSTILKGPFPFVSREELVERSIDSHGLMKIALKVDVDMGKLAELLGREGLKIKDSELYHPHLIPKLIIVFGEEVDGIVSKSPYSSQVMHDFLMEREFDVLLDDVIRKDVRNELAIQGMLRGDAREALKLAHNVGAVIVLSGKLSIHTGGGSAGRSATYFTEVSFQAINADSGRIIASVKHKTSHSCLKSSRGVQECIALATRKTGEQLVLALESEFKGGKSM